MRFFVLVFSFFIFSNLFSDTVHIVQQGENLLRIANQYNITVSEIKEVNRLSSDHIRAGQRLIIKQANQENPIYYTVKRGDTLTRIAVSNNTSVAKIREWNRLPNNNIRENQRLIVGHEVKEPPPSPPQQTQRAEQVPLGNNRTHTVKKGENLYRISLLYEVSVDDLRRWNRLSSSVIKVGQHIIIAEPGSPVSNPIQERRLEEYVPSIHDGLAVLPVQNVRVLSEFGMRNRRMHNGIDLGGSPGSPIYAVLPGKVVFSGIQRGFGNVIILEHANHIMTVYGHNEANLVRVGEEVFQGQLIARMGNTGNASTYHLHFEYRIRGVARNPRELLHF